ncbi:hypothetical protein SDRG_13917 [Saprolegnia diclina VS20]|uniref:F-box domain-containing protein n=1 Tax=Saprolegnia diclina (strain VS20) TaxID=1156394 RepID=T0Q4L3_SAPDV|nr:hypothetical protein SDRG_13917 [Saprolegnia diclina VS20]EQC28370.1 hypothetical protein SDRG_13917 [Saprolegnia diclina VS20]|eukprot:XP_008618240.1 hypothetical protein SDRG_13917 [Saprolegnia diclina VS20]
MDKKKKLVPPTAIPAAVLYSAMGYVESQEDVAALLMAVPPAELCAPLAALRTFMTTPMAFDGQWPTVDMSAVSQDHLDLVYVALPAIPGLLLPPRHSVLDRHLPALLAALPSKLKMVDTKDVAWFDEPEFRGIVPLCTQLSEVYADVFHLRTTLLPPSPLAQHLEAGRVTHLMLHALSSAASANALASILAAATSVTTLGLNASEALINLGKPLHHVEAVQLYVEPALFRGDIRDFMALLDLAKVNYLDASGFENLNWLVPFLGQMSLLEELVLTYGAFSVTPDALMDTPLPSLNLLTVHLVTMDAVSFETFRLWASKLRNLREAHWLNIINLPSSGFELSQEDIAGQTDRLSVLSTRSFKRQHILALLTPLLYVRRRVQPLTRVMFDLESSAINPSTLRVTDITALLDAVQGRPDVALALRASADDEAAIAAYAEAKHVEMVVDRRLELLDCRFRAL